MTWIIFRLTLQQLMSRRRLLLVMLLAMLPALVALAYQLGDQKDDPANWTADVLLDGVIITILLPLVALIFGTSALGSEIEDGTIIHLLAKPVARREIIIAKLAASWFLTALVVVPSAAASGAIGIQGAAEQGVVTGFVVAALVGALVYSALFVLLSALTSRALIAGLAYVFVWEGLVNSLFRGTRYLSVHQCCVGVADLISSANVSPFDGDLTGAESVLILAVAGAVSVLLAVRLLERYQVGRSA